MAPSGLPSWLAPATAALHGVGSVARAATLIRGAVRWLAHHTGLPALLVAAVLVAVGYRLLKRSARFAMEVAAVALALLAATELGWLRW